MFSIAGGGLSGNKESGQLRFGGREKPFRAPLYVSFVSYATILPPISIASLIYYLSDSLIFKDF